VNGELISEDKPGLSAVSTTPFPEKRVPRRGLIAVTADDPAFVSLCKEQGLEHLVRDENSPLLPNGLHSSPMAPIINGLGSPTSIPATTTSNGGIGQTHGNQPISPSSESGPGQARPLVNGVNRVTNGGAE